MATEDKGRVNSSKPRHRKRRDVKVYPTFQVGQDRSVPVGTKKAAITAALAVGVLAVSGSVAGGIGAPDDASAGTVGGQIEASTGTNGTNGNPGNPGNPGASGNPGTS